MCEGTSEALICLQASGFLQIIRLFKRPSVDLGCSSGTAHVCVHPPNLAPAGPSAHELRVAFGTRHDDIHPDPHGFGGGRHHVVEAVVGLHTEGQRRVWALEGHKQTIRITGWKKKTDLSC